MYGGAATRSSSSIWSIVPVYRLLKLHIYICGPRRLIAHFPMVSFRFVPAIFRPISLITRRTYCLWGLKTDTAVCCCCCWLLLTAHNMVDAGGGRVHTSSSSSSISHEWCYTITTLVLAPALANCTLRSGSANVFKCWKPCQGLYFIYIYIIYVCNVVESFLLPSTILETYRARKCYRK